MIVGKVGNGLSVQTMATFINNDRFRPRRKFSLNIVSARW